MTDDQIQWLVTWAYRTVSLSFLWHGKVGYQFIFMPLAVYPWCNDDPTNLYQAPEGYGGDRGRTH